MNRTARTIPFVLFFLASVSAHAAPGKTIPKDVLVLEPGVVIRQFGDNRGRVLARPAVCDELLLLEPVGFKGGYLEVLYVSEDAQKVGRGWVSSSDRLYIFPEPRATLPRSDATPGVAFPWASKSPQPGDRDVARVTSKSFLFACLDRPHPAKAAAVLTQVLDRYATELTLEEVVRLLPVLKYTRDEDRGRVRELLARFKDDPSVKEFIAANPIFGAVIEPETKPLPTATPPPVEVSREGTLFGFSYKVVGIGAAALALVLIVLAFWVSRRKKKAEVDPISFPEETGEL
jgi:hypothetical protein